MLPSVDIVIPVYNEEQFLDRCLDALTNLDYPQNLLRIIVVDNFSQDRTIEIASCYDDVTIKQVPKHSIAYSRNQGAREGTAEIIAFIDGDCVADRGWLKNGVANFLNPGIVATGSYPIVIESEANSFQRAWARLCKKRRQGTYEVDWLPTGNLMVKRSVFVSIGGFNEDLITCEDADLGYRLAKPGSLIDDPEVTVYHLREPKNYSEFWKKEYWHSQSNVAGAFSHGVRLSELSSLIMPFLFLTGTSFLLPSIFFLSPVLLGGAIVLLLFPPLFYTFIKYRKCIFQGFCRFRRVFCG